MDFPKKLFKFYWSIITKFPFYFGSMFISGIILYILNMVLFPYANKWAFEIFDLAGTGQIDRIKMLLGFIALNYIALWLFRLFSDYIKGRTQPIVNRYIGYQLYNRVYGNDTDFFINRPAGQIANKVDEVRNNQSALTIDFWKDMVGLTIGFFLIVGTLLTMNIWLSVFVMACGIIRAAWTFIMQKPINKVSKKLVDVSSDISGTRTDSLGNFITARLFANEKYENKYIYDKQEKQVSLNQKKSFLNRLQNLPSVFIFLLLQFGIVIFCYSLITDGVITIADAAFAFVGGRAVAGMFSDVTDKIANFFENRAKAKHAYVDILQDQSILDKETAKNLKVTKAEIDFEKVSFDYGNKDVIKNFDLHLARGEKIGVVGLSGAGKTTLVNLILRLYDVKAGSIKIDGQDLRDVKQDSLRGQIAFVPQESVLFNRSLLENIRYAKPTASKKQVIEAAKKANIHEFIEEQPKKYDTLVGNRGIKLSGGQRQRIAIARAILKDSDILILDEATSALDSKNESLIQNALEKIMKGKTTIAIAHRLSTLRNMDRIIVMDRGKIVETGTHSQLLRKSGLYKKLWNMQTDGFIQG